jgi:hypothetical protein
MPVGKIEKSSAAKSNVEWQAWGEKDPLFGVIPLTGRERDGAKPWTDADFYETGRADWEVRPAYPYAYSVLPVAGR